MKQLVMDIFTLPLLIALLHTPSMYAAMTEPVQTISLREYVDARFNDQRAYINDKFTNAEKEVATSRESMEKRLDGMNEFRAQLKDQTNTFVTRGELYTIAALILAVAGLMAKFFSK